MSLDASGLLRAQHDLHGRIARSMDTLKKAGVAKLTTGTIDTRLRILDSHWAKFEENHETLQTTHWKAISDDDYTMNDLYGCVEEAYVSQRAALVDLREEQQNKTEKLELSSFREPEHSKRQLPRIQLPSFSGKFDEWSTFKDMFQSIIGRDTSLIEVEKLHYLRTCLKGEAEQLVRNIPTTSENYERVWDLLVEHYENKRLLVRSCFSAFTALPKMKSESVGDLRRLFHGMLQTVGSLEGIGRPIKDCDLFIHLVVEMLDNRSRREWEAAMSGTTEPPAYAELKAFLESRLCTLEALHPGISDQGSPAPGSSGSRTARSHLARKETVKPRCSLCKKEHYILSCGEFTKKSPAERRDFAVSNGLCFNCFGEHRITACPSKKSCAACKQRHHSSIHDARPAAGSDGGNASSSLHTHDSQSERASVLLATARILLQTRYGTFESVRALIDPGSKISLISGPLVQRLRLPRTPASTAIYGVGGKQMGISHGCVSIQIKSRFSEASFCVTALVLPRITVYGGRVNSNIQTWPHVRDLPLADPDFASTDPVEILLGADVYATIVQNGLRKGAPRTPVAQETSLGWILSGLVGGSGSGVLAASLQCSVGENLNELVARFWQQEELPQASSPLTESER